MRSSLALAPVLAAIDRSAALLVQHGGGWQGSARDIASTYGLHVLFLITLLAGMVLLRKLHRIAVEAPEKDPRYSFHGGRVASPRAILFPYEAAYLAGGPPRVAETALAALVDEGWIESTPSGRLHLGGRGDLVTSPDPVGIPVLGVVASGPPRASREIRRRASHLREVRDVSRILYARRLLVARPTERRLNRIRWAATAVLGVAAAGLLAFSVTRTFDPLAPPVVIAAACFVLALVMPSLAWQGPLFRTVLGEAELAALLGSVNDKARWVADHVWSDEPGGGDEPWADVDRIVDALQRPAASRPVQLGWLWGREDALMAIALRGPRGIPDRGLRRGLNGRGMPASRNGASTGLSTPVHKMVGSDDA
jgi:uncharacterized protein (TIGR04222 family)